MSLIELEEDEKDFAYTDGSADGISTLLAQIQNAHEHQRHKSDYEPAMLYLWCSICARICRLMEDPNTSKQEMEDELRQEMQTYILMPERRFAETVWKGVKLVHELLQTA